MIINLKEAVYDFKQVLCFICLQNNVAAFRTQVTPELGQIVKDLVVNLLVVDWCLRVYVHQSVRYHE